MNASQADTRHTKSAAATTREGVVFTMVPWFWIRPVNVLEGCRYGCGVSDVVDSPLFLLLLSVLGGKGRGTKQIFLAVETDDTSFVLPRLFYSKYFVLEY